MLLLRDLDLKPVERAQSCLRSPQFLVVLELISLLDALVARDQLQRKPHLVNRVRILS